MVSAVANEAVVSLVVVDSALDMVVMVGSMLGKIGRASCRERV